MLGMDLFEFDKYQAYRNSKDGSKMATIFV